MAFDELPKIDRYSLNSDESAIKLQTFLNRSSGFVLREDVPDLGCDFDAELIRDQTQASNWRFPLQLKSVEKTDLIRDGQFISYPFKTSRLGYLLRRLPAFGLIVLFDVETKVTYYEYADEVYNRLMNERSSDDWKTKEKVNIIIPIANVLNADTTKSLHKKFVSRFEQGALMHASHGAKYGLPNINLEKNSGYDFNNLADVKNALKKMGMSLLLQFDLQIVFELLIKLPAAEILADKDLCLIALITYAEAGKHADSVFYTERIRKRFELTEDERHSVDFIELKNQLRLGNIGAREYVDRSRDLLPKVSQTNSLVLKINILFFELSLVKGLEPMPIHLGEETQKLFFEIEDATMDVLQKQYLKLWNAENMERWISHFRSEGFTEMQLRENMGKPLSLEERKEKALTLIRVHQMFYLFLNDIDKHAKDTNNALLQAHIIKLLVRFDLSFEIDQISFDSPVDHDREPKVRKHINLAGGAFNIFLQNNLFLDAYLILLYQIDFVYVAQNRYGVTEFDLDKLLKCKSEMEKELEFDGDLAIPALLQRKIDNNKGERKSNYAFLKGLNEGQLDTLAEIMFQSNKFPRAQKVHILNHMKNCQLFQERCSNPSIRLEEVYIPDDIVYAEPISFFLKNQTANLVSTPDSNVDRLLKSWGY